MLVLMIGKAEHHMGLYRDGLRMAMYDKFDGLDYARLQAVQVGKEGEELVERDCDWAAHGDFPRELKDESKKEPAASPAGSDVADAGADAPKPNKGKTPKPTKRKAPAKKSTRSKAKSADSGEES